MSLLLNVAINQIFNTYSKINLINMIMTLTQKIHLKTYSDAKQLQNQDFTLRLTRQNI